MASTAREKAEKQAPGRAIRLTEEVFRGAVSNGAGVGTVGAEYPNFVRAQGDGSDNIGEGKDLFARLQDAQKRKDAEYNAEREEERALAEEEIEFLGGMEAAERSRAAEGEAAERAQVSAFLEKREAIQRGAAIARGAVGVDRALEAIAGARRNGSIGNKRAGAKIGLFNIVAKRKRTAQTPGDRDGGREGHRQPGRISGSGLPDDGCGDGRRRDADHKKTTGEIVGLSTVLQGYEDVSSSESEGDT